MAKKCPACNSKRTQKSPKSSGLPSDSNYCNNCGNVFANNYAYSFR